jgi:hypothetical protein
MATNWPWMCVCGCGEPVRRGKRFLRGHHWKTLTLQDRFWPHVVKTETCWLWTGAKAWNGYGILFERQHAGRQRVHRLSYEWHVGPIPEGLDVCHRCDVRNCVRPDHLFLGTRADNLADMRAKGRAEDGTKRVRGEQHHLAILDTPTVRTIRARVAGGERQSAVARDMGLSKSVVSRVVRRASWAHVA